MKLVGKKPSINVRNNPKNLPPRKSERLERRQLHSIIQSAEQRQHEGWMVDATLALLMVISTFVSCLSFRASMEMIVEPTAATLEVEVGEDTTVGTRERSDRLFFHTCTD